MGKGVIIAGPGAVISADGRFVVFTSAASNLVVDDTNGKWDVFVKDRATGRIERVSVDAEGRQANDLSGVQLTTDFSISADGRFVVFTSNASNLVANDTNGELDVFVKDRATGRIERVSVDAEGRQGNDRSRTPSISANGRYIAFMSAADNLVANDTNGKQDVFVTENPFYSTTETSLTDTSNLPRNALKQSPPALAKKAVVLVHGWNSDAEGWPLDYMARLCAATNGGRYELIDEGKILADQYGHMNCKGKNWDIWYVDWRTGAGKGVGPVPSLLPWEAVTIARAVGTAVGATLWNKGYEHIHFIGHSAGSMVINSAKDWLRHNLEKSERPTIQLTFLDPYEPESNLLGKFKIGDVYYGLSNYGFGADWVDVYVDTEDSVADLVGTEGANLVLMPAYNIDVTKADPAVFRPATTAHAWPYKFYKQTIDHYFDEETAGVGFAFSAESKTCRNCPLPGDTYSLADLKRNTRKLCVLTSPDSTDCDLIHDFEKSMAPTTRERVLLANIGHVADTCLSDQLVGKPLVGLSPSPLLTTV